VELDVTALAVFVLLDAAVLAGWALVRAAVGAGLGIGCAGGLALLELTLLARAGLALARMAGAPGGFGHGLAEPAVHLGYICASVVVLPLVAAVGSAGRGDDATRRWDGVLAALACLAVGVVTLRMTTTGRPV
jgi:hypothetical protein